MYFILFFLWPKYKDKHNVYVCVCVWIYKRKSNGEQNENKPKPKRNKNGKECLWQQQQNLTTHSQHSIQRQAKRMESNNNNNNYHFVWLENLLSVVHYHYVCVAYYCCWLIIYRSLCENVIFMRTKAACVIFQMWEKLTVSSFVYFILKYMYVYRIRIVS